MKFLLSWLRDYLEISLPPRTLAERLTMGGLEVGGLTSVDGDWLFEAEVTPNRPDLLNHVGIARETAALLGRTFHMPKRLQKALAPLRNSGQPVSVAIDDPKDCFRYVGIVLEGVKVRPSPPELARRLERLGVRPVNNVVDITNFCLFELGQPLHAFDLNCLEAEEIRVRRAKTGEKLVTIDGQEHTLTPELLVIADAKRPVALAGVMGGKATEITPATKRILIESAWFDPALIRRATRTTKLSSDSAYRFERGVDPEMVPAAAMRAARMIQKLASAKTASGIADINPADPMTSDSIPLLPRRAQQVLGMPIYPSQQRRFLERLGCRVQGTARRFKVNPPSFRRDLKIPEDLYEELARLWGYERCQTTAPPLARQKINAQWQPAEDPWIAQQDKIRNLLAQAGLQEIQTYSLISRDALVRCRLAQPPKEGETSSAQEALPIQNPLSAEQALLRPSLLPGALEAISRNLRRKSAEEFHWFELGHRFDVKAQGPALGDHPAEKRSLSLTAASPSDAILRLKGALQFLFKRLGLEVEERLTETTLPFFSGQTFTLLLGGEPLGVAGLIHPEVLETCEIPPELPVAYAELNLEGVIRTAEKLLRIQPLPKVPPVVRDLAIAIDEKVAFRQLEEIIQQAGQPLLQETALFDLYRGKQVETGKKSMAFRLSFSAGDRTLTDDEVTEAHQQIVDALKEKFQAELR